MSATIAKLGGDAAFSGKVGKDPFGYFLKQTLDAVQVDTSMLVMDEKAPTTLAFVSLKQNGSAILFLIEARTLCLRWMILTRKN